MSFSQISESDIDRLLARLNEGEGDPCRLLSLDEAAAERYSELYRRASMSWERQDHFDRPEADAPLG